MTKILKGKIHGTTIELEEPVLLPDGTEIEIQIRVDRLARLEHAFGGWRDDPELDKALDQIDCDRHETPISRS
jgi:hypothetical protein